MKKTLLLGIAGCLSLGIATAAEPVIIPEFYAKTISPNGKWIVNDGSTGQMLIYDVPNADIKIYGEIMQGNGNCITNDGMLVGYNDYTGVIILNGQVIEPTALGDFLTPYFHGVTSDGTRAVGLVGNDDSDPAYKGRYNIAYCFELTPEGQISKAIKLPVPEKDFFGGTPQFDSAVWISDDGKTILGQEVDEMGKFVSPIVYLEDAEGNWSYVRPTESLFNPEGLQIPEYPGEFDLIPPQFEDYMTAEELADYRAAYDAWESGGYVGEFPDFENYMTDEEKAAFNEAAGAYDEKATEYNDKLQAYYEVIDAIIDSSFNALRNGMVLAADGKSFIMASVSYEESETSWFPVQIYKNYIFDLTGENAPVEIPSGENTQVLVNQILDGGILMAGTTASLMSTTPPQSYIYTPGAEGFVAIEDFLAPCNPELASWINQNLEAEIEVDYDPETYDPIYEKMIVTGHASASSDLSVITGGELAYLFFDGPMSDYSYATYLFNDVKTSGIASAEAEGTQLKAFKGGIISVKGEPVNVEIYNLSGCKVFGAKGVNGVISTGVEEGVYIIKAGEIVKKIRF